MQKEERITYTGIGTIFLQIITLICVVTSVCTVWYVIVQFNGVSPGFDCQFYIQRSFFYGTRTCDCPLVELSWCHNGSYDWRNCEGKPCTTAACGCNNEIAVWDSTFAIIIIAGALNFLVILLTLAQLINSTKEVKKEAQLIMLAGSAVAWILFTVAAPLMFLNINNARETDQGKLCQSDFSIGACHNFYGSVSSEIGNDSLQYKAEWYPTVGWYFGLSAAGFCIISFGMTFLFIVARWNEEQEEEEEEEKEKSYTTQYNELFN